MMPYQSTPGNRPNGPRATPNALWAMSPQDFNEWRAQNDLPRLFAYFGQLLPEFNQWLKRLPFELDVALRIVPTADLFKGEERKVVIKRPAADTGPGFVHECFVGTQEDAKAWWGVRNRQIEVLGEFEPYFRWAKNTLGRRRFFIFDKANRQVADDFSYRSWMGLNVDGQVTQARLFHDFAVLKLGQTTLNRNTIIGSRNLDFCDLDYLRIVDDFHGSYWTNINYSSVRGFELSNASIAFVTFYKCAMDTFLASNSRLQDFYFEFGNINEFKLNDCFVYRLGFHESAITPFIRNCEIREAKYSPQRDGSPAQIARTYRLFRAAYQSSGLRREAAECYYKERVFERKSFFHPYQVDEKKFQGIINGGRLHTAIALYRKGVYDRSELWRALRKTAFSKLKMLAVPKYMFPLVRYRLRWIASGFESLLWGYGEKPLRIICAALAVMVFYTTLYHLVEWVGANGNPVKLSLADCSYFSVVTFTTLGYGDIKPTTTLLKCLAGSEALLGACLIGLLVAGFSNRSRY